MAFYAVFDVGMAVGIYLLKVNNRNTRTRGEKCSKLAINTLKRQHWRQYGVFILNSNVFHTLLYRFYCSFRACDCMWNYYLKLALIWVGTNVSCKAFS